jgi:hypothetical protein
VYNRVDIYTSASILPNYTVVDLFPPTVRRTDHMPPPSSNAPSAAGGKNAPGLFLGLELATDQLRATLVDEHLELVGVEVCDFDTELPSYSCVGKRAFFISRFARDRADDDAFFFFSFGSSTSGGIFTTPGEAYTTPVMMWIEALGTCTRSFISKNLD